MADTLNYPGIRCFITDGRDYGHTWPLPGFADDCHIPRFYRLWRFGGGPSECDWLDPPGIALDARHPDAPLQNGWRWQKNTINRNMVVTMEMFPLAPGPPPSMRFIVTVLVFHLVVGPNFTNVYQGDVGNVAVRQQNCIDTCAKPDTSPCEPCATSLCFEPHPSYCGIPEPGPLTFP